MAVPPETHRAFVHLRMASAFASEAGRLVAKPPTWCAGMSKAECEQYLADAVMRLLDTARSMGIEPGNITRAIAEEERAERESGAVARP